MLDPINKSGFARSFMNIFFFFLIQNFHANTVNEIIVALDVVINYLGSFCVILDVVFSIL